MQHGARQNERPSGRRPSANGARYCPTRFTGVSSADPRDDAARRAPPVAGFTGRRRAHAQSCEAQANAAAPRLRVLNPDTKLCKSRASGNPERNVKVSASAWGPGERGAGEL